MMLRMTLRNLLLYHLLPVLHALLQVAQQRGVVGLEWMDRLKEQVNIAITWPLFDGLEDAFCAAHETVAALDNHT